MADLNNLDQIKSLDNSNLLGSIQALSDQVNQAWTETQNLSLTPGYITGVSNIVVAGMGGSGLNAHIVKSLFAKALNLPFEIVNGYDLPHYVGPNSLVVLSSFSGGTEETLASANRAKELGARVTGLCSGSKLGEFLKSNNYPSYIFDPQYNPSNQPRMGLGYSVVGLLGLLNKLGVLKVSQEEITKVISVIKQSDQDFGVSSENQAKELAKMLKDRFAVIAGSEFLTGNAHAFANQTNENAKTFSAYHTIPELNHHLLEGLTYPQILKSGAVVILLESNLYYDRVQKRYEVTKQVLDKQQIAYASLVLNSGSELEQSFRVLVFGSYVTFYTALLYDLDPTPIPWVDFFKNELAKLG